MTLEDTLTSRDKISAALRHVLDEATGKWGIRVNRVELKAVDPPASIQEAMEKQMRAERDRRAAILTAEGVKQSQILTAEGEKQSAILRAEGRREAQILEAEGQSKAIETVFDAIHRGDADPKLLAYQYLQVLPQIAQGESNKVWIIPSEVTRARELGSSSEARRSRSRIEINPNRDLLRAHGTDHRGVEPVRDAALALAPVVVCEHLRRARAPAPPDPHAHARIRLDVPDVGGAQAVLGDDPERVAVERLPDRHLARLSAPAAGRLEEHVARERQAGARRRPHERVQELGAEECRDPPLVHERRQYS